MNTIFPLQIDESPAAIPWSQFHIYCSFNRKIGILLKWINQSLLFIISAKWHSASSFPPRRKYDSTLFFGVPLHWCWMNVAFWMAVTNKTGSPFIMIIFCIVIGHYFVITHKISTQSNLKWCENCQIWPNFKDR